MRGNLNKIFWGLIFISININLPIDILPNIVGYGLILYGLNRIVIDIEVGEDVRKCFSMGIIPSKIMIGVEAVSIIMTMYINDMDITYQQIYTAIISIIGISHVIIIFSICSGLYEIAKVNGGNELSKRISSAYYAYIVVWMLGAIVRPLTLNIDRVFDSITMDMVLALIAIVLIIIQLSIIILIRGFSNKY